MWLDRTKSDLVRLPPESAIPEQRSPGKTVQQSDSAADPWLNVAALRMNVVAQSQRESWTTRGPRRRRSAYLMAALLVVAIAGVALARIGSSQARPIRAPGTWCGGELWKLMTLSDRSRGKVNFADAQTTIAALSKLTPPARITAARSEFERHVWRLRTVVDRYRVASSGELVLILYSIDSAQYMNAYMPNPNCLSSSTRYRGGMIAARRAFTGACPKPTGSWQLLGATVDIAGVGFWNPVKTTRGALPNGAELRPVTALKLIAGCGAG
jgi:hypothetical protein